MQAIYAYATCIPRLAGQSILRDSIPINPLRMDWPASLLYTLTL